MSLARNRSMSDDLLPAWEGLSHIHLYEMVTAAPPR
jgi:hypothetical protein